MTTGLQYFLAIAEEKSISRAAQKLFISQQALSDQMRRLEAQYHAILFVRRPQFALTEAGEALLRSAQKIRIFENALITELDDIQNGMQGKIRLGIHTARARTYLVNVIALFHAQYPLVDVEISYMDTQDCEAALLSGRLDLFLGVEASSHDAFDTLTLGREPVFLYAPKALLEDTFGAVPATPMTAAEVAKLPLIVNPLPSTLRKRLDSFFAENGCSPRYVVNIPDFSLQMQLVSQGIGACFCPQQIAQQLQYENEASFSSLCKLRIREFNRESHLALITYRDTYRPQYFQSFVQLMKSFYEISSAPLQ